MFCDHVNSESGYRTICSGSYVHGTLNQGIVAYDTGDMLQNHRKVSDEEGVQELPYRKIPSPHCSSVKNKENDKHTHTHSNPCTWGELPRGYFNNSYYTCNSGPLLCYQTRWQQSSIQAHSKEEIHLITQPHCRLVTEEEGANLTGLLCLYRELDRGSGITGLGLWAWGVAALALKASPLNLLIHLFVPFPLV